MQPITVLADKLSSEGLRAPCRITLKRVKTKYDVMLICKKKFATKWKPRQIWITLWPAFFKGLVRQRVRFPFPCRLPLAPYRVSPIQAVGFRDTQIKISTRSNVEIQ